MKRILCAILALCLALSFFASCKKRGEKLLELNYNEEGLLCGEDGVLYKYAPMGYEPVSQGDEYAVLKATLEEKLYVINGIDPKEWITMEYTGAGFVFYNADITLPTLSQMGVETMYVCEEDVNSIAIAVIGGEETEDRDADRKIISTVVSLIDDPEGKNELWPRGDVNESFRLKMYSPDWPAIYYTVTYAACDSGNFIYDKVTQRCVEVGDLLDEYIGEAA
ncbi:MAG: hypothetical protein E7575_05130 [Ruminococcaceae bacterium]|nr:hypothetical protein [Oscillospiraceae bacterium]